jgi:tape measure domain-containing protein
VAQIKITADTSQATREINRLSKELGNLEKSNQQAAKALGSLAGTAKIAVGAFAALTAAIGVGEIINYTSRWTDLNSRLINATGSQQAAKEALDAISASARGTYSSLEETAKVFVRNSMALNELGYTTNEQIKVSETLNNAIAVSGARGVEAASALDAFAQAVARGKMEGEDFNRLIENSPRIVKALADGLGVTTGEFRKMITEGKITSDVMIPALMSQMGKLQKEAEAMPATISDAFIVLQNSLFKFIGSTDQALGISQALSKSLVFLADNTGIMVGAIAGLTVAVGALLIPLIPAATAMAILTGGLAVAGAVAVGAALGFAAQKAGLLGDNTKKAVDQTIEQKKAAEDAAAAAARAAKATTVISKEQQKLQDTVRKGFTDALKASVLDLKYQQDILAVGKNQADINKIINEHKQKHLDAGIKINAEEEKKLRANLAQGQSIQKQNELLSQQKQLIEGYVNAQSPGEKLVQDIENLRRIIAGEPIVVPIKIGDNQENDVALATEGLKKAKQIAGENADAAIAQYSKLYGEAFQITNDYNKAVREIDDALRFAREAGGTRELERITALEEAKIAVEQNSYRRRLEMEINLFNERDKIRDLERQAEASRAALLLQNEKDIFGGQVFSSKELDSIRDKAAENKKAYEENATKFVIKQGADALAVLGTQNKKAFEAYKALKIAQTIMDTYAGARAAFTSLAGIPVIGPILGGIAAAAAVAAGLAQVAQIRSLSYSGRALGGPVMGGKPYLVGESGPELFTPATTGSITRNSDLTGSGPVNVNFTIVANDTAGFDQLLTSRKGVIQQIISDAMLERGQRSMV